LGGAKDEFPVAAKPAAEKPAAEKPAAEEQPLERPRLPSDIYLPVPIVEKRENPIVVEATQDD